MALLRCWLFNTLFYSTTVLISLVFLPALLFPKPVVIWVARFWGHVSLFLARWVCGIRLEVRGRENLLNPPAIFASKHQSAFDTIVLNALLQKPVYVLKRELLLLPLYGLYLWRAGSVAIDRSAGASAMKQLVKVSQARLGEGCSLIIFPEGTRTHVDVEDPPYHPGVAALFSQLDVPIVPVALNSGICWGKNALNKKPGTIVVEFLPPIQPGSMDRKVFMRQLKEQIEGRSRVLVSDARRET